MYRFDQTAIPVHITGGGGIRIKSYCNTITNVDFISFFFFLILHSNTNGIWHTYMKQKKVLSALLY